MTEPDWIAGEPNSTTHCLMCPARTPDKNRGWGWLIPNEQPRHIFAGYFCSDACTEEWRQADDDRRLGLIFGTKDRYRLLGQVAHGFYVQGNEEESQEVPIFSLRLDPLEAAVEIEMRAAYGRIVTLTHTAPFRLLGWREPAKNSAALW